MSANRHTLTLRVHLDVIGLPPSLGQIQAYD